MAAEEWSDTAAPDVEVLMKQRGGTEFLHAEKMSPTDMHQYLQNICVDQKMDVSTARWWVECFRSNKSDSD